jgi:membrane protein DedA with SNARE-associated domain
VDDFWLPQATILFDLPFDHISYLGIIVILVLTGSGLPIPEEVPIIAAGIAASVGTLNPWWAFISCLVGALLGDAVLYSIGYHFGHSLVIRHPRFAHLLHAEREARIEQMIRKHELKVFFLSRCMVGVRAPVYLAAGILRIPFLRFLAIDFVSATSVVGVFFWLSYAYGERLTGLIRQSEIWLTVVLALAGCAVLGFYLWRKRRKRRELAITPQEAEGREACAVGAGESKPL